MSAAKIIEDDFKRVLKELDVDESHDLKDVFRYFYIQGLRVAAKLDEEELR